MKLACGIVLILLSLPAFAFDIVTTSASVVNDVFTNDGVAICEWDRGEELFDGGWLISRAYYGEAGSPAEGKWVYEYRVDMTDATDPASIPEIESVDIFNGPMLQYDYNADSTSTDDVYVVTSGGLGSIGLASVTTLLTGDRRFLFSSYVAGGGGTGLGQSSYHFGFISDYSPHAILATVNTVAGPLSVPVWAPSY